MTHYSENTVTTEEEQSTWQNLLENERSVMPLVDIYETENEFVLKANMPGVDKDNVHVKLEDNTISVFGKVNYEEALDKKYILNENIIANYYRKFKLADSIDESKIEAKFENGQLVVNLPKSDKFKPRTININ